MGSRHRKQNRLLTKTRTVGAAGALLAASPAAVGVLLLSAPTGAAVGSQSHPKPVSQEGRVVAVSADSLTAQSADGSARTYVVTPQTASVTADGGGVGTAAFGVNDEVSIVGEMRDGTAVATAVAEAGVSNLDGPPMDSVVYTP
jgi:hypothetical protein